MRDYFKEFLVNGSSSRLGAAQGNNNSGQRHKIPMKAHVLWGASALALSYLSWKVSKWHTLATTATTK